MGDLGRSLFCRALKFCSLQSFKPPSSLSTLGRRVLLVLLLLLLRRADRPPLMSMGSEKGRSVQRNPLDSWIGPRNCVELSFSASPTTGRFGTGSAREACTCRDLQQRRDSYTGYVKHACSRPLFNEGLAGDTTRVPRGEEGPGKDARAAFGVKDRVTPAMADWHLHTELAH